VKTKIIWVIALSLFSLLLVATYLFTFGFHLIKGTMILSFLLSTLSLVIAVCGGAALFGLLFSLIPRKKKPFGEKFRFIFPLLTGAISLAGTAIIGNATYRRIVNNKDLGTLRKYDHVEVPAGLDCSSVRNGKFEAAGTLIERKGNMQTETVKLTGTKYQLTVKWLSDCEYEIWAEDGREARKVKIVAVSPEGYGCYVIPRDMPDIYAAYYFVKRVK
jgi:hypothetical protein